MSRSGRFALFNSERDIPLEMGRQRPLFWESISRIASSRKTTADQTFETKCTGEGEKWRETFTLRMDGDRMILRSSRDRFRSSTTFFLASRCAAKSL